MEICVISHESCPWEGAVQCGIHVMAKEEEEEGPRPGRWIILFTAVRSLTLSSAASAAIHPGVSTRTHGRIPARGGNAPRLSHKEWGQSKVQRRSSCQTTARFLFCLSQPPVCRTCLKCQALALSAAHRWRCRGLGRRASTRT